ncbi:hypothetical protein PMZ80_001410 [Knufia obscura]|uniref:Uncharacterized protein n=2 Tax=Knufia TaxID=430999 RepID=A0AAN8EIA6_9EURO|nr:hypothetical protein PMZ80_001410 [Knufia obscura]KAK5956193.1 hypothetical protein OHC33_002767 [Knufia fluminis]
MLRPTAILRASHARTPLIKFLGKRSHPKQVDHTPQPHPASPTHELPESFASYRQKVQQHGPLGGQQNNNGSEAPRPSKSAAGVMGGPMTYGAIGGTPGSRLGPIKPKEGEYFDVSELPRRFQKKVWSDEEMDAVASGGASLW